MLPASPRTIATAALFFLSGCSHGTKAPHLGDIQGLPRGNLLLFGEMHGSIEAPALISQLARSISISRDVAIGLEIPLGEQPLIDSYLISRGTKADKLKLMESDFWQRGRDGRSSTAMFRLIDDVRRLKENGAPINVFAFDDQPGTKLQRDVAIANGIRRFHELNPKTQIIALMGNIHASQEPIIVGNSTIVTSGKLLSDLSPVSVLVSYPKGTIWACMPDCGIHDVNAAKNYIAEPGFREGASWAGYRHTFLLPSITPPRKE